MKFINRLIIVLVSISLTVGGFITGAVSQGSVIAGGGQKQTQTAPVDTPAKKADSTLPKAELTLSEVEPTPQESPQSPAPEADPGDYSTYETLTDLYVAMLEKGETEPVDISRFKAKNEENSKAWNEAINGKGRIAYECRENSFYTQPEWNEEYITTTMIAGMDSGFAGRYEAVNQAIDEALSLLQEGMTDLDKALILHDYVVDKAKYVSSAEGRYRSWGVLAYGEGVCMSYALAYNILLTRAGIEVENIASTDMNHMWNAVKLDGMWYQADITWDDTQINKTGKHYYFLRSDEDFCTGLAKAHYSYAVYGEKDYEIQCTDTRFDNWFVHDVKGDMFFRDGFWYFADGDKLMKARADGSEMQVVSEENSEED